MTLRTFVVRHGPKPPDPFTLHGVALGPDGGVIVSARHGDHPTAHVITAKDFPATLQPISDAVEKLINDDETCRVVIDGGMHGLDLWRHLGGRRRRLYLFEPGRPELRRTELAGSLRSAWESKAFTMTTALRDNPTLRKAIADSTREDAAERPEIVALSLAVIDRRRIPRIG